MAHGGEKRRLRLRRAHCLTARDFEFGDMTHPHRDVRAGDQLPFAVAGRVVHARPRDQQNLVRAGVVQRHFLAHLVGVTGKKLGVFALEHIGNRRRQAFTRGVANHLIGVAPEELFPGGIDAAIAARQVLVRHAHRHAVEHLAQVPAFFVECVYRRGHLRHGGGRRRGGFDVTA